jgi:Flp pilus assembly protein TadD
MPDTTDELLDEAHGCIAMGELAEAVPLLRRCVELDAQHFDAWQALAMSLFKLGQTQEAIGAGLMATTLQPNDLLAWTGLSQMFVQNGQIAEAEDAKGKARILSLGGKVVRDS